MPENDNNHLPEIIEQIGQYSTNYLENIDTFPVGREYSVTPDDILPDVGSGALEALKKFRETYEHLMVASSGPRYFGFVTGGVTPAALAGDWLTTVFDQNPQSIEGFGDISARIETNTIKMLLELLCLPDDFNGGFVTGATMANFSSLAVARQWMGSELNIDIARDGLVRPMKCFAATAHSSSVKSLAMLGLGSRNLIKVKVVSDREAMDVVDLEERLKALGGQPAIVISSAGTVNTVDFDDMAAIAALKRKYNFWWHIDAAFGGFVACSPKYKHLLDGWQFADSITVDCHKWLNTPYDGGVFLVRKEHSLTQVQTFQNSDAPYLGDAFDKFSYLNFLPENSRRLRALPAWFTLMSYGRSGYQSIVENNIELAHSFAEMIRQSKHFKLMAPVRVNVVAFTFSHREVDQSEIEVFLSSLNARGKVFVTPTKLSGRAGFRAAFVNWRTKASDIEILMAELEEVSRLIVSEPQG